MSICNVEKVRQSQRARHWQTPHNKKFVQAPHVLGSSSKHKYCMSSREVRINLKTVVGGVVCAFARNRTTFAQSSRRVLAKFAARSGQWSAPL